MQALEGVHGNSCIVTESSAVQIERNYKLTYFSLRRVSCQFFGCRRTEDYGNQVHVQVDYPGKEPGSAG